MQTILLRAILTLGVALGLAVTGPAMVEPEKAQALPAYAQQTGKGCGYCHVNPTGGGPRNANGKKFEANGHKLK